MDSRLQLVQSTQHPSTNRAQTRYLEIYDAYRQEQPHSDTLFFGWVLSLKDTYSSSTLESMVSLVRSAVRLRDSVTLNFSPELKSLLANLKKNEDVKRAAAFCDEDVLRFIQEGPPDSAPCKIALILGYFGTLRICELFKILPQNIIKDPDVYRVLFQQRKTSRRMNFFVVPFVWNNYSLCSVIDPYLASLPESNVLFWRYENGSCGKQHVGINTVRKYPRMVATYLGLGNISEFSGHSLRATSATAMIDKGETVGAPFVNGCTLPRLFFVFGVRTPSPRMIVSVLASWIELLL